MEHPRPLRPLVVVPAYNEASSIGAVLAELHAAMPDQPLLVVDDGSEDGTGAVARAAGALVLTMPFNSGVGGAMRAGFRYAVRNGFTCVIQVDADGQHDPADVPRLLESVRAGNDIVIGARFAGVGEYAVRGPRKWAMTLLAKVMSKMARVELTDVTSGFRASAGPALAMFAAEFPEEYLGDTLESLVMASRARLAIAQVPVHMRERAGGTPSQSPVRAAVYLMRAGLVLTLAAIRSRPEVPTDELSLVGAGGAT